MFCLEILSTHSKVRCSRLLLVASAAGVFVLNLPWGREGCTSWMDATWMSTHMCMMVQQVGQTIHIIVGFVIMNCAILCNRLVNCGPSAANELQELSLAYSHWHGTMSAVTTVIRACQGHLLHLGWGCCIHLVLAHPQYGVTCNSEVVITNATHNP